MKVKPRVRHRRGVASFFAVAALGLIATAVLAMAVMLKIDHRRTQASTANAQLRHLLLAGAAAAEQSLESIGGSGQTGQLVLPDALVQANAAVHWRPTEPELIEEHGLGQWITVIAEYGQGSENSAYQRLCFVPDEDHGGYRIAAAIIGRQ